MSKTVKYWLTGTRLPDITTQGTPAELLKWMGEFPPDRIVPPLAVLNHVFRKGFFPGGFNGDIHWEPFQLTPDEYDYVASELTRDASTGFRTLESPDWIQNEWDWLAYVASSQRGVPLEPYRTLLYELDALGSELKAARSSGKRLTILVKTLQLNMVTKRMMRLLARYHNVRP